MQIAVLSDIHANPLALEAVLADLPETIETVWFLGDAVGYGPEPVAPLLWLKRHVAPTHWVLGNHDAMLANLLTPSEWAQVNEAPKQAMELNRQALLDNEEANSFWQNTFSRDQAQPQTEIIDGVTHVRVHSGQGDQTFLFRYVYAWQEEFILKAEFETLQAQAAESKIPVVQCFGHTHVPTLVLAQPTEDGFACEPICVIPGETYVLESQFALVNPGSVGQPRDLDQRAAYAILDTEARTVTFRRVAYDWRTTYRQLVKLVYPDKMSSRILNADPADETPDFWRDHYAHASQQG